MSVIAVKIQAEEQDVVELSKDLNNWMPMSELPKHYAHFTYATLKTMFWKRAERQGLERCSRKVGKKLFINAPLFGMYLAGVLPEQNVDNQDAQETNSDTTTGDLK